MPVVLALDSFVVQSMLLMIIYTLSPPRNQQVVQELRLVSLLLWIIWGN